MAREYEKRDWGATIGVFVFLGLIWWGVIAAATSGPAITTEDIDVRTSIPYESKDEWSNDYDLGEDKVTQTGAEGERVKRYTVTYEDDEEVSRELVAEWVDTEPVTEITTYGTYQEPTYDYSLSNSSYGSYNDAGCVKNQYVSGYYRSNGTYVGGYWRNSPSDNCY